MLSSNSLQKLLRGSNELDNSFAPNVTIQQPSADRESFAVTSKNSLYYFSNEIKNPQSSGFQVWYDRETSEDEIFKTYVVGTVSSLPSTDAIANEERSSVNDGKNLKSLYYNLPNLEQLLKYDSSSSLSNHNSHVICHHNLPKTHFTKISDSKSSISLSNSQWAHSKFTVKKTAFTWNIENFSLLASAHGETVISEPFQAEQHSWCLHLAPHGKTFDLREYVSICLVMHSENCLTNKAPKKRTTAPYLKPIGGVKRKILSDQSAQNEFKQLITNDSGTSTSKRNLSSSSCLERNFVSSSENYSNFRPPQSKGDKQIVPIRFRCSLLDRFCEVFAQSDTERFHPLRPRMGLGFGRFIERSWLDLNLSNSKEGSFLLDTFTLHAEVFWLEEPTEVQKVPLDLEATRSLSGPFIKANCLKSRIGAIPICPDESKLLSNDFVRVLKDKALSDIQMIFSKSTIENSNQALIYRMPFPRTAHLCICHDQIAEDSQTNAEQVFPCHRAFLASGCQFLASEMRRYSDDHKGHLPSKIIVQDAAISDPVASEFLRFIYGGFQDDYSDLNNLAHPDICLLLSLSKLFRLKRLKALALNALTDQINIHNICCILLLSKRLQEPLLHDTVIKKIYSNSTGLTETKSYAYLMRTQPEVVAEIFCLLSKRKRLNF